MKRFFIFLYIFFSFTFQAIAEPLKAGVLVENFPEELFGSWRVNAVLENTNARKTFRPQSIDFWNLSRMNETIKLENPLSGANAEINIETIEENLITFSKKMSYDGNKILTDTVTLRFQDNKFSGINSLKLEYFSLIDNHLMKTETALYRISGEKIYGESVIIE